MLHATTNAIIWLLQPVQYWNGSICETGTVHRPCSIGCIERVAIRNNSWIRSKCHHFNEHNCVNAGCCWFQTQFSHRPSCFWPQSSDFARNFNEVKSADSAPHLFPPKSAVSSLFDGFDLMASDFEGYEALLDSSGWISPHWFVLLTNEKVVLKSLLLFKIWWILKFQANGQNGKRNHA